MIKRLFFLVSLVAIASRSFATEPITFTDTTLENGLRVILHADDTAPVVSTYLHYWVGSKDEQPGHTGFAHYFEHLMFEGTKNIERGQIDKLVSGAGGNLNASTSWDRTDYYLNLPANQLELALWIESERLASNKIDETGVETQRQVVTEELRQVFKNQPYGTLTENMVKGVFDGTPYAWHAIGHVEDIEAATIEEFREFYQTFYHPNNLIMAIAGDIDIDATLQLVKKYFGDIPHGPEIPRPEIEFDLEAPGNPEPVVIEEPHTPLNAVVKSWRAPTQDHPDTPSVEILTKILGDGASSRLYQRLVSQERAAVQSSAFSIPLEKVGMAAVFAVGNRGVDLETISKLMDEEIERVLAEGVTEEELQKALNQTETEIAFSLSSTSQRASQLAYHARWYDDPGMVNSLLDRYANVTTESIASVAKKYFSPDKRHDLHYAAAN